MNEQSCVSIKLHVWKLKFEFHKTSTDKKYSAFAYFHTFKLRKPSLMYSFYKIRQQFGFGLWAVGHWFKVSILKTSYYKHKYLIYGKTNKQTKTW